MHEVLKNMQNGVTDKLNGLIDKNLGLKESSALKDLLLKLNVTDVIVITFYFLLSFMNIIFMNRVEQWFLLIIVNIAVTAFVLCAAHYGEANGNKIWKVLHYWYLAPLILLTFKELYVMIKPIRVNDYDYILINADRFIFGTDPTRELLKIANPVLTEILQIAYGSFYILPIILGVNLYLKKRLNAMDFSIFSVVYGFFLSYIGYFFLPAIGPRFTLHDFYNINNELPGLFLTNFLREIVNAGESIPYGTPNPASIVQRDVFPSGHTEMTLITMYLAAKLNVRSKNFLLPMGTLLIFATVYLRYHYVIDLIGGTVFMIVTMWSGKYIYNKWQKFKGKELFSYEKS